jgi:hypothetical protein
LDALRVSGAKHDRSVADVGVLLRAIQSGADVVPALQKALAVQFASLRRICGGETNGNGRSSGGFRARLFVGRGRGERYER